MVRRNNFTILALVFVGLCGISSAARVPAATIATVSSDQAFLLDGHTITAPGVSSWPVVVGDDIVTAASPANLSFPDGSLVRLAPHSHVKITGTAEQPTLVLLTGNLEYRLVPNSKLTLVKGDHAQDTSGQAPSDPQQAPSGASAGNPHNMRRDVLWGVLIAGAGAAMGAGIAAAVNSGGPATPPLVSSVP